MSWVYQSEPAGVKHGQTKPRPGGHLTFGMRAHIFDGGIEGRRGIASMRFFLLAGFACTMAFASCSEETLETAPPFVCTPETCPNGSCKLQVAFADDCVGQVPAAEVLLNDALEPSVASAGTTFESTGDIPGGTTAIFWVRDTRWQWGPLEYKCPAAGDDGTVTLSCKKADEP